MTVNKTEFYTIFARYYDELMEEIPYDIWARELIEIIKKYCIKEPVILDVGCGTGTLMHLFLKKDFYIEGLDQSVSMIEEASKKCPESAFFNKNIIDFKSKNKKYDVIISVNDTFNYILCKKEIEKAIQNIFHALKKDGLFLLELTTLHNIKKRFHKKEIKKILKDGTEYEMRTSIDYKENICRSELKFSNKTGSFKEIHLQKIYNPEELITHFKKIGFSIIGFYESSDLMPYREQSFEMFFVLKK